MERQGADEATLQLQKHQDTLDEVQNLLLRRVGDEE